MRSDYILYALAIVFFIIAVIPFAIAMPVEEMALFAVLGVVLGIMSAAVGYAMRPKVKAPAATAPQSEPTPASQEPAPQAAPAMSAPAEAPKAEAPAETPKVEAPPTPMIEAPKAVPVALEKPVEIEALPPVPEAVNPPIVAAASLPAAAIPLTHIRGINQNRADQMKIYGISSVEELAKASAADLAVKLGVSEKIVKMWIGSAKKLAK
jgi:predicted flap endonuclease-1-like 5' DNA nuclease